MTKPTYLQGVLDCERMLKEEGFTFQGLYDYVNNEAHVVGEDYRWSDWLSGFHDAIVHFQKLKVEGVDVC